MKKKIILIISLLTVILLILLGAFLINKGELKDSSWKLNGWYISSKSLEKNDITLNFESNKISGNGGVNSYGGDYKVGSNNKIKFTNIYSTEMASEDLEVNEVESIYFNLLSKIKYYEISNDKLILYDEEYSSILIFAK